MYRASAAMVIPLVGLLVTPTSPTMREATVTKKNANTITQAAASRPRQHAAEGRESGRHNRQHQGNRL